MHPINPSECQEGHKLIHITLISFTMNRLIEKMQVISFLFNYHASLSSFRSHLLSLLIIVHFFSASFLDLDSLSIGVKSFYKSNVYFFVHAAFNSYVFVALVIFLDKKYNRLDLKERTGYISYLLTGYIQSFIHTWLLFVGICLFFQLLWHLAKHFNVTLYPLKTWLVNYCGLIYETWHCIQVLYSWIHYVYFTDRFMCLKWRKKRKWTRKQERKH